MSSLSLVAASALVPGFISSVLLRSTDWLGRGVFGNSTLGRLDWAGLVGGIKLAWTGGSWGTKVGRITSGRLGWTGRVRVEEI